MTWWITHILAFFLGCCACGLLALWLEKRREQDTIVYRTPHELMDIQRELNAFRNQQHDILKAGMTAYTDGGIHEDKPLPLEYQADLLRQSNGRAI